MREWKRVALTLLDMISRGLSGTADCEATREWGVGLPGHWSNETFTASVPGRRALWRGIPHTINSDRQVKSAWTSASHPACDNKSCQRYLQPF